MSEDKEIKVTREMLESIKRGDGIHFSHHVFDGTMKGKLQLLAVYRELIAFFSDMTEKGKSLDESMQIFCGMIYTDYLRGIVVELEDADPSKIDQGEDTIRKAHYSSPLQGALEIDNLEDRFIQLITRQ